MNVIKNFLLSSFWEKEYFNNTLWDYLIFFFLFIILSFVLLFFKKLFLKKIFKKEKGGWDSFLFDFFEEIESPFFIFLSFYFSLFYLFVSESVLKIFDFVLIIWGTTIFLSILFRTVDFCLVLYLEKNKESKKRVTIRNLGFLVKVFLAILVVLTVISFLGVNVTTLIAGMGIGGVAVAFALQNILSDLFSSFSIYFDKPFTEGDFIIVGDKAGKVEKIGIKSTRMRALQGEEIIFSNKELTSVQVHNLAKLKKRRVDLKINIIHETETKKLEKIPELIKKVVEKEDLAEFDRAHFSAINDFSLEYTIIYFVKSAEYLDYMNVNEKILLNIKKVFEKEKIKFAYPTQIVYVSK